MASAGVPAPTYINPAEDAQNNAYLNSPEKRQHIQQFIENPTMTYNLKLKAHDEWLIRKFPNIKVDGRGAEGYSITAEFKQDIMAARRRLIQKHIIADDNFFLGITSGPLPDATKQYLDSQKPVQNPAPFFLGISQGPLPAATKEYLDSLKPAAPVAQTPQAPFILGVSGGPLPAATQSYLDSLKPTTPTPPTQAPYILGISEGPPHAYQQSLQAQQQQNGSYTGNGVAPTTVNSPWPIPPPRPLQQNFMNIPGMHPDMQHHYALSQQPSFPSNPSTPSVNSQASMQQNGSHHQNGSALNYYLSHGRMLLSQTWEYWRNARENQASVEAHYKQMGIQRPRQAK